jgi:hypothetical protein
MTPPPAPDAHATGRPVASLTSAGRRPAVPAHQIPASYTRLAQAQGDY